jgi:hypothetical protein
MTPEMSAVDVPDDSRMCRNAVVMPDVTSGVVGVLILLTTVSPSMSTASVFVPPTSIPIRKLIVSLLRPRSTPPRSWQACLCGSPRDLRRH